jgi:hypothetical protein
MDIERRLYHYGLGVGIPYRALNSIADVVDVTRNMLDLSRRRRLAQELVVNSKWAGFVPKNKGFALFGSDMLPHTQEVLAAVRNIIADRRVTGWKARVNNPFYQLERPEDFRDYPALMDFALSDPMLEIVCGYYGIVPQLKEVGIWLTPPQTQQFSSQLYHLDKPESRLLKLFMNVDPNVEEVGPLTLLPADVSNAVRSNTSYEAIYFRGDGRLTDEQVFSHCSPEDQVSLVGDAGTGGFADTSNCFHYGSRCRSGERKMFTISFMLPHKAREVRTPIFDLVPEPQSEVRRLVLAGAKFASRQ